MSFNKEDWEVVNDLPQALSDRIESDCSSRGTQHTQTTFNGNGTFRRNKTTGVILGEYRVTERSMGDSDTSTLYIKFANGVGTIHDAPADFKDADIAAYFAAN